MITKVTYDLSKGRRREDALMLHIGRMTVKAAALDELMTSLLAQILAPADPGLTEQTLAVEMFGVKHRYLRRVLPDGWDDRKALLSALEQVEHYRNQLAHSTVHTVYTLADQKESTRLFSPKKGWSDSDPSQHAVWEGKGNVLRAVLYGLVHASEGELSRLTMRGDAEYFYGTAIPHDLEAALTALFPES